MSHRKQPVRQARVNPARNVSGARGLGASSAAVQPREESPPGFFPGITHFTDSISGFPKDMIKHFTMLKEVDAKIGRPEEALKKLVDEMLKKPIPSARNTQNLEIAKVISKTTGKAYNEHAFMREPSTEPQYDPEQRQQSAQIVMVLRNMLVTMDEKIHVLGTANEELEKHIARCESSWPQIEKEISEITRLGNPNHRALDNEVAPEKKLSAVGDRPRREAAMSHAHATLGGEDGRTSRKHRAQHLESDYDEPRPTKGKGHAKGKRNEAPTSGVVGLGIANGMASNKRRKVEKSSGAVGSQPMDRTATSAYSRNGGAGAASPSQAVVENTKKRARGNAVAAALGGRKRAGTQNSANNSPAMGSSPVLGNFSVNARGGNSPALGAAMQRSGSTRGRQNSAQNTSQPRVAPTSAARNVNGTAEPVGAHSKSGDVSKVKTEDGPVVDSAAIARGSGRAADQRATSSKKEDTNTRHRPPSISTGTRNNGRASKTATPVSSSFPDPPRPRSGRNTGSSAGVASAANDASQSTAPLKRSHKKGAGLAAQQQKAAALEAAVSKASVGDDAGSALDGEDDEDNENEPRYCYCGGVSYGEMVACDWKGCQREWFHLDCAGLSKAPGKEKWYCRDCAPKVAKLR